MTARLEVMVKETKYDSNNPLESNVEMAKPLG